MTLGNKMRARRPAEHRRPRAGIPALDRAVPCRAVTFEVGIATISNRNIARLEPYLTPANSTCASFLTATKSNFSVSFCVPSLASVVADGSRCSSSSALNPPFLIDKACRLEAGVSLCKQGFGAHSNRRWIRDSRIRLSGAFSTSHGDAPRCSAFQIPSAERCSRSRGAAAHADPLEKSFHASAFAPHQFEELSRIEVRRFLPEECLHAPADVRRSPRRKAMPFRNNPVVAQRVQHCESELRCDSTMPRDREGFR
jgi:hypothetical protein